VENKRGRCDRYAADARFGRSAGAHGHVRGATSPCRARNGSHGRPGNRAAGQRERQAQDGGHSAEHDHFVTIQR